MSEPMSDSEREQRLKQLDILQMTISRMAQNSFTLKGWAVTLCSALLAFSGNDAATSQALLAVFPAVVFWCLDGYYLSIERKYRARYRDTAETIGPHMSLDLGGEPPSPRWWSAVWSRSVAPIYLSIIALSFLVAKRAWLAGLLGR